MFLAGRAFVARDADRPTILGEGDKRQPPLVIDVEEGVQAVAGRSASARAVAVEFIGDLQTETVGRPRAPEIRPAAATIASASSAGLSGSGPGRWKLSGRPGRSNHARR